MLKNKILKNSYFDSATLMSITGKIANLLGSNRDVAVMMATDTNKELMQASGLLTAESAAAGPNDLVLAVRGRDEEHSEEILKEAEDLLLQKNKPQNKSTEVEVTTVEQAVAAVPESNFAVVSLPGAYAAREVKKLLQNDKHVLLFSDNVSIDDEIKLKDLAIERGLLMMGPDCGTAQINGVGLGFANQLRSGNIGIVAASGTGLQEVATLISNLGGGISQAFGTGGRDIKEQVGGRMMLACLDILDQDPATEKVVIVSKPPSAAVVDKVAERLKSFSKPVVTCFLGADRTQLQQRLPQLQIADNLADAALLAVGKESFPMPTIPTMKLQPEQKYIRGLYCGGTLAYESILLLKQQFSSVNSNIALTQQEILADSNQSVGHTIIDLGDDEFTRGKPHPMIEPQLRSERLLQEALDPETAVLLLDVELGYGSHSEAGQLLAEDIKQARCELQKNDRNVFFLVHICASYEDYQGYAATRQILEDAGAIVLETNAQAANLACSLVAK